MILIELELVELIDDYTSLVDITYTTWWSRIWKSQKTRTCIVTKSSITTGSSVRFANTGEYTP